MVAYSLDPDISRARTLPNTFYHDESLFRAMRRSIFARSWQLIGDIRDVATPNSAFPTIILDGYVNEPVLITRDSSDRLHCLSNVCTHRGAIVQEASCQAQILRCPYHGRKFALDGKFQAMPGFAEAKNFPTAADNLPQIPFGIFLHRLIFASLAPIATFETVFKDIIQRIGFLPLHEFRHSSELSRDYMVRAHWALYCENYLEGLHIPFVHQSLTKSLNLNDYSYEEFEFGTLQIGIANSDDYVFDIPPSSPDYGKHIAAYYYWIFPNLMLNFYPWGLSINVVKPLKTDLTRVSYSTYVWKDDLMLEGSGAVLDRVEREDEMIVESVMRGMRSNLYKNGRYSPEHERGVYHFHSLLMSSLQADIHS